MKRIASTARRFFREESGATMVEYAIMVALIAVICIIAVKAIGSKSNVAFENVETNIS